MAMLYPNKKKIHEVLLIMFGVMSTTKKRSDHYVWSYVNYKENIRSLCLELCQLQRKYQIITFGVMSTTKKKSDHYVWSYVNYKENIKSLRLELCQPQRKDQIIAFGVMSTTKKRSDHYVWSYVNHKATVIENTLKMGPLTTQDIFVFQHMILIFPQV